MVGFQPFLRARQSIKNSYLGQKIMPFLLSFLQHENSLEGICYDKSFFFLSLMQKNVSQKMSLNRLVSQQKRLRYNNNNQYFTFVPLQKNISLFFAGDTQSSKKSNFSRLLDLMIHFLCLIKDIHLTQSVFLSVFKNHLLNC